MSFHLRPVSAADRSASPSTSTSTASERSPPPREPRQTPALLPPHPTSATRPRRPLSPSSLRDVDLSARDMPRKYPAPPTGHELMALFPPPPPLNIRPGPTSGYFQREERAFFAQAGKEIVRVRIEVDMPQNNEGDDPMTLGREGVRQRQSPIGQRHSSAQPHSPPQNSPTRNLPPMPYPPQPNSRPARTGPIPVTAQPVYPVPSHGTSQPVPPNAHPPHSPPVNALRPGYPVGSPTREHPRLAGPGNQVDAMPEDFRDDDESWRRPIPHNQRRRAGKHTKRVVVK